MNNAFQIDVGSKFEFTDKQRTLQTSPAPNKLQYGGIRSGKTLGAMMYGIFNFTLRFECCDILILRRNYKELESGAILDFRTFVPQELYTWNDTKKIATFHNGSRVVFGHCQNLKMRDIEQYLGQAYPFILVDECGQFSPDAWELLSTRNIVNARCKENEDGELPVPEIWGCTNPIGEYWGFYESLFLHKKPYILPEKSKQDKDGTWWAYEAGEWRLIYDPTDYEFCHSTPLDNPHILKRDPGLVAKLNKLPKHKRDKMLLGLSDKGLGQFFTCFDPNEHVIDLKTDPDAIIWEDWQPVWIGWDWAIGHWTAVYFFTKALVRTAGGQYKRKTVCFKEIVEREKDMKTVIDIIAAASRHPNGCSLRKGGTCELHNQNSGGQKVCMIKVKAAYLSFEQFNRRTEMHGPDVEFSKLLVGKGLPPVTKSAHGAGSRRSSAAYMFEQFSRGKLVILNTCPEIITAVPRLQTDPDDLSDVKKPDGASKSDDCYDGFRYGIYGEAKENPIPENEANRRELENITDPINKKLFIYKKWKEQNARAEKAGRKSPPWMSREK